MTLAIKDSDTWPDLPFWTFSVEQYRKPTVASACMALQDAHGLNVNILLFWCWQASLDAGVVSPMENLRLDAAIEDWHNSMTLPTRRLRQGVKLTDARSHYDMALSCELECEHYEQYLLSQQADELHFEHIPMLDKIDHLLFNLQHYWQSIGEVIMREDLEKLSHIMCYIFEEEEDLGADMLAQRLQILNTRIGMVKPDWSLTRTAQDGD